ncbi:hypothetical protein SPRG_02856 [Saprolegnia parasitica CBS 223.65]|uniref:PDZ domain-containing protein n=1 Tax=Saprolegnia parasitica (strain CBS 223.65) TaxID=695850 RepID=A0A067CNU9_SAPPC|nr:hypothetical protein SPRG_02856 [Saprolegnia parasitica CBS 223.65]KDO32379.1 hypothetical protein SPRG_02856 [Saprolegnia parasitica CBS 223.65]|eukprot:XP_012196833.1 hypothetical protein SPRG_02856 [Saprolegnia parasitica CBS 223.65]
MAKSRKLNPWAEQMIAAFQLPPLKDDEYFVQWETGRLGVNIMEDKESELPIVWTIIDPSSPLAAAMEVGDYLLCVNELRAEDNTFHSFLQLLTTKQKPVLLRFRRARPRDDTQPEPPLPRSKSFKGETKPNGEKPSLKPSLSSDSLFRNRAPSRSSRKLDVPTVRIESPEEPKPVSPRDLLAMDPYRKYRYEFEWVDGALGLYFGEDESLNMPVITRTLPHASPELLTNVAPNDILVSANGLSSYDVSFADFFTQLQHWPKPIHLVFQTARPPSPSTPKGAPPSSPPHDPINRVPSPPPDHVQEPVRESTKMKIMSFGHKALKPTTVSPNLTTTTSTPPGREKAAPKPIVTTPPRDTTASLLHAPAPSPPRVAGKGKAKASSPVTSEPSPPSTLTHTASPQTKASLSPPMPVARSTSPPAPTPVTSPSPTPVTSPPPPPVSSPNPADAKTPVFEDSDSDDEEGDRKAFGSEYLDDDLPPAVADPPPVVVVAQHDALFASTSHDDDSASEVDSDMDLDLEEEEEEGTVENEPMPKLDYPVRKERSSEAAVDDGPRVSSVPKPLPSRGGGERSGKARGRGKNKRSSASGAAKLAKITENDEQTIPLLEPNSVNMKLNVRGKLKSQRVSKMDTPDSSLYLLKWKENRSIGLQLRECRLSKGVYPMVVLVCREPCCESLRHVSVGDVLLEINGRDTAMMGVKKTISFVKTCSKTALLKLKRGPGFSVQRVSATF